MENNAEKQVVVDVAKDATAKKYNKTPRKGSVINKYKIDEEDDKLYVSFAWNKFTVSCSGLNHDYTYNKEWVVNCVIEGINNAMDNFTEVIRSYITDKGLKLTEDTNE